MIAHLDLFEEEPGKVEGAIIDPDTGYRYADIREEAKGKWVIRFPLADSVKVTLKPVVIKKFSIDFRYPVSSNGKKTLGFRIDEGDQTWLYYYADALTCKKRGLLKRNIGCTVFGNENGVYLLFRVGFPDEAVHYYCLYEGDKVIAIIKRVSEGKTRGVIYYTDPACEKLAITAAVEEIMAFTHGDSETRIDPSAGHYISRYQEERDLLDRSFIREAEKSR